MSELRLLLAGAAVVLAAACTDILGDDFTVEESTSSGAGASGPSGTNGSSSGTAQGGSSSTMSTTSTSTGGGSGPGGGGGSPPAGYDCSAPAGAQGSLVLTEIAGGLTQPLLVKSPPEDPSRLFIVEQPGRIQVRHNGQTSVFLDISSIVQDGGERGLLGLAFHPDYAQNQRFFVHYTNNSGSTAIAEYAADPSDPNQAIDSGTVLLTVSQPYSNHNGGSIEFSPNDGFLYIGLGDGGSGNDPMNNAQDMSTNLGKMLRIDVATMPFSNPAGNLSGPIWDLGLRNPFRFSFDGCTGDLYIGDVGQNAYEEVNVEPAGQGGKNYGWRIMEGMHCNTAINPSCNMGGLTQPLLEYTHGEGCSITGGYVYRGSKIPWLRGAYLYGDFCSGNIWFTRYDGTTLSTPVSLTSDLSSGNLSISSFGQDATGEVDVVDHGGSVYRIDPE